MADKDANLFELWGRGIHVSYSTTSIAGVALFNYRGYGLEKSFKGDEIRVGESELGREVTVTLETIPDLRTTTFTVLIPKVKLCDDSPRMRFSSVGIHAERFSSIGGPNLVRGPMTSYDGTDLRGVAQSVES